MKRLLFYSFIYVVVVCFFGGVYAVMSPPPGKTSSEMLGIMFLACFGIIALYGVFFVGFFGLGWLLAWCSSSKAFDPGQIVHDEIPDRPESFGYKCQWIAVKSDHTEQIADILELSDRTPCNWMAGIQNGYLDDEGAPVFVSPPVRGWSFIVGRSALPSPESRHDELVELLNRLSERFGEACFFGTMRITDFTAWFRSKNGKMIREFMYADDVVYDEGERTGIESEVAYIDYDSAIEKPGKRPQYCGGEDWVMQIAADWSLDPTKLGNYRKLPKAVGILGYFPKKV